MTDSSETIKIETDSAKKENRDLPESQASSCPAVSLNTLDTSSSEVNTLSSSHPNQVVDTTPMRQLQSRSPASSKTKGGQNPSTQVTFESVSTLLSATNPDASHHQKRTPHKAGKKGGRRRLSQKPRHDAHMEKRNTSASFAMLDDEPNRIVNPLCDIPRLEGQSQHNEPPNACELQTWSDLIFGKPDTFPLSYYARLLGFNVDPVPKDKYVPLDAETIPLVRDTPCIPPPGQLPQIWKQNNVTGHVDPVYTALVNETTQVLDSLNKASINVAGNRSLSSSCLDLAKDILGIDVSQFRADDKGAEYGVSCGGYSIRYGFVWYQFSKDERDCQENTAKVVGPYGVSSLASRIQKPSISELILQIKSIDRRYGPWMNLDRSITSDAKEMQSSDSPSIDFAALKGDDMLVVLVALCLEHARECGVFYALVQIPDAVVAALMSKYFQTVALKNDETRETLLCDLNMCSSKYAFLLYKTPPQIEDTNLVEDVKGHLRMLVRLPVAGSNSEITSRNSSSAARSATDALRSIDFNIRVGEDALKVINANSQSVSKENEMSEVDKIPSWDVLRIFELEEGVTKEREHTDQILESLILKRDELISIESKMEPKLRSLMETVVAVRLHYEKDSKRRNEDDDTLKEYQAVLDRRIQLDMLYQKQRDQDMDAVCEICSDGEVTPDNQILFCEACNVAIHQFCYGIERVPEGDYYCIACRYFGREKPDLAAARQHGTALKLGPNPLPINCELCPQKLGAFIRTDTSTHIVSSADVKVSKWVHVLCAKWQGLNFIDNKKDCVEDVIALKRNFRGHGIICQLCQGDRGAFNKCRESDCKHWMHVTCARAYGRCEVVHGENCYGAVQLNPWSLLCPEHSDVIPSPDSTTLAELILLAKEFPPEPQVEQVKTVSVQKPFGKMSGKERRDFLAIPENEKAFVDEILSRKLQGVRCEVCYTMEDEGKNLTRCTSCAIVFCVSCKLPFDDEDILAKQFTCQACKFVEESMSKSIEFQQPKCVLCFQPGGWLRMARGIPMKKWPLSRQKDYEKTLFEKRLWVHALCAMWQHPTLVTDIERKQVNLNDVIMTHGKGFILGMNRCELCGHKDGLKMKCSHPNCRQRGHRSKPSHSHVTCARQAGFDVDTDMEGDDLSFHIKCYRHVRCDYAFRARLEDLIEFEKLRAGKKMEDSKGMSTSHASRLLNSAILVMSNLGWAWRWAEWWVEYGSNWEPLIEPGQDESKMTKVELKIVDSTPESRCADARRCRLAALGAALRNRSYDDEEDGPTIFLERALRAVLKTPSLVGPLTDEEIDFFLQWLCIAYRSKSRLLGMGAGKISLDENAPSCLHEDDKSPKYVLDNRRLPGKQPLPDGIFFESDVEEVDDFLKVERLEDGMLYSEFLEVKKALKEKTAARKETSEDGKSGHNGRKRKRFEKDESDVRIADAVPRKKRGRPRRDASLDTSIMNLPSVNTGAENGSQLRTLGQQNTSKQNDTHGKESLNSDVLRALKGEPTRFGRKPNNIHEANAMNMTSECKELKEDGEDQKCSSRRIHTPKEIKRTRGKPTTESKSASITSHEILDAFKSQTSDRISRPRRKPVVRYNEDDWDNNADFDDDEPEPVKRKMRLTGVHSASPKRGRLKMKRGRKSLSEVGGLTVDSDDIDYPLSSLRIPRKKHNAVTEEVVDDDPEPEPDLSSPKKRGRHRGKLEAAKVILLRNEHVR